MSMDKPRSRKDIKSEISKRETDKKKRLKDAAKVVKDKKVEADTARNLRLGGTKEGVFTGATASLRGSSEFAAFASAKGALRQLAQSMARELGPKGIHVASVIIDGVIDSPRMHERFPERMAQLPPDGALKPEHIAENYWQLHNQPRDAWAFEVDLRPWAEKF